MTRALFTHLIFAAAILIGSASIAVSAEIVKRGNLRGDRVDYTQGSVQIIKDGDSYTIKLGSNFKTKSGPALYVYLGNGAPQKRIGRLKSTSGAQSYRVPASVNPADYSKIYIYCVPFNAIFGSGSIN